MNKRSIIALIIAAMFMSGDSFAQKATSEFPVLRGPYLGQTPPGMTAKNFAPEVLSRYKSSFCSVFSPCGSEYYFVADIDWNGDFELVWMRRTNNVWGEPEILPFDSDHTDNDISLSPDGYRAFWRSWRPLPGNTVKEERSYLWYAYRTEDGWSEAMPVETDEGFLISGYPGIAYNGTIYFNQTNERNVGKGDLHRIRFINGKYSVPVNLGRSVNTEYSEGDMCVSPDESFLVVSCWNRPDNNGESDLYVSFRKKDGTWTELINMGPVINSDANENCPQLTPDGKYFFYLKYYPNDDIGKTYWIDSKIIDTLKPKGIK